MGPKLSDLVDQWLVLDKQLVQYIVGDMPFGWGVDGLKFIECRYCWHNMGWLGADRIFSNEVTIDARNPEFFKILKLYLVKHTKKCKIQR